MRHCPNDGTPMQQFPKGGVHIDRCPTCGGIFLDAGELEALERLAANYYGGGGGGHVAPAGGSYGHGGHGGGYHGHGGHYGGGHHGRRKKKGFLGELFD